MTESFNGLYKWELIYGRGPWRGLDDVEFIMSTSTGSTITASTARSPMTPPTPPEPKLKRLLPSDHDGQRDRHPIAKAAARPGALQ
jgi:hypothetical protein